MFKNVGKTLTLLREGRLVSQADLARKAKISRSQLSRYEQGKAYPKLEALERLLRGLDISASQFFNILSFFDQSASLWEGREKFPVEVLTLLPLFSESLIPLFTQTLGVIRKALLSKP
jgi:transcriptional regulator with XRE-family HTH domain